MGGGTVLVPVRPSMRAHAYPSCLPYAGSGPGPFRWERKRERSEAELGSPPSSLRGRQVHCYLFATYKRTTNTPINPPDGGQPEGPCRRRWVVGPVAAGVAA